MSRGSHVAEAESDVVELGGRAVTYGLVAAGAAAGALAYGWRAAHTGDWIDWAIMAVLVAVSAAHAGGWREARTPRLVADDQGIRFRRGGTWAATPWEEVTAVEVDPDRRPLLSALRNRELVIHTRDDNRATVRFDAPTRGTDVMHHGLRSLGAPVVVRDPKSAVTFGAPGATVRERSTSSPRDEPVASRAGVAHDPVPPLTSVPAVNVRRAVRAEVRREVPEAVGLLALQQPDPATLPEAKVLRGTEGRVGLVLETVSVPALGQPAADTATAAAPVDPYPTRPAASPVIGPELAGARERFGLSVDELAERTRIRPHVIESIEVDDFEPCGGDFYARGHVRALARVLGVDPLPLIRSFDELYASAPIDARRVFEAELATGPQPVIRVTSGGPNWAALLGMVLVLAIAWTVATMVTRNMAEPASQIRQPGAAAASTTPADPGRFASLGRSPRLNRVRLEANGGDSVVAVRSNDGGLLWRGTLTAGESRALRASGRVTVLAADGGVVTASVNGVDRGRLGANGQPVQRVLGAPRDR